MHKLLPTRLSQIGLGKDKHKEISLQMNENKVSGLVNVLSKEDHIKLVELMA